MNKEKWLKKKLTKNERAGIIKRLKKKEQKWLKR